MTRTIPWELDEYGWVDIPMPSGAARTLVGLTSGRVDVSPAPEVGRYRVKARQFVGTVVTPDVQLLIRPKVTVENLFYLLGIGMPEASWLPGQFPLSTTRDLLAVFAEFFLRETHVAVDRGLLRSYREKRDRVAALRGRLDFPVLMSQPARGHPIPCAYDEYTADILENRILLAATRRLLRLTPVDPGLRASILRLRSAFDEVSDAAVSVEEAERLAYTRLNQHYETPVRLASLILRASSLVDRTGQVFASAFLIDMNDVFQRFMTAKLQEHLRGVLAVEAEPLHYLADPSQVQMYPDLVFRRSGRPAYVGDLKYHITTTGRGLADDYYQLLAYATVLQLDEGVLIYCRSDGDLPAKQIEVRHAGKRLWTFTVSLDGDRKTIDASVGALADWIVNRVGSDRRMLR